MDEPRIKKVKAAGSAAIEIAWRNGRTDIVNLAGWIASNTELLGELKRPAVFATPKVGHHGFAVFWGDEDGDLAIDAHHLSLLAAEQRPFGPAEFIAWQAQMGLSNREAADFLHVSLSSLNGYRRKGTIVPETIAMLCRAAMRDPILMNAHFRPRLAAGRPRKAAAA